MEINDHSLISTIKQFSFILTWKYLLGAVYHFFLTLNKNIDHPLSYNTEVHYYY